jgi:hypothetical protein
MIVIAEMESGGVFEAPSKKKLTDQMIQHFAENNEDAGQIKAVYCVFKDDSTEEFCKEVVGKIQNIVDNGVSEYRKIADQEYRGQKQIESDYHEACL